jgi:Tetratricopeptide repeat/CHAT domain
VGARALQEHVVDASPHHAANERELLTYEGNLAATLHMQGHLAEAKAIQERLVQAQSRIFGRKHPDAIGAQSNLAWTLRKLGELDRARQLAQEAADSSRELLGAGHPTTFAAEGALIHTLGAQGDDDSLRSMAMDGLAKLPTMATSISNAAARYAFLLGKLEAQCEAAAAHDGASASQLTWIIRLLDSLPATSTAFRDALELCHADERHASLAHYIGFHASWVRLCMLLAPHRLPQAIAPLHGMESWSTLLNRLQDVEMAAHSPPHAALQKARQDLQQLRLHLTTLTAMIDSALGHMADLEARLHNAVPDQGSEGGKGGDGSNGSNGSESADPAVRAAVSAHMIAGLHQELNEQLARRTEWRTQEGAAIQSYRSARDELAREDSGIAALLGMPALTSADLAARLAPHEALLITVALPPGRAIVAAIRPHATSIVELAELPGAMDLAARYQAGRRAQMRGAGLRDGCFAARKTGEHAWAADTETIATATLVGAVQRSFWQPLALALAGALRIHLVTGPGHHSVPLECGMASHGAAVHRYFGLPAYLSVHDRPLALPPPHEIDIIADSAWDNTPIPFVEAEAELVHALVSSHGHARRIQGHELLTAGTGARRLLLCVHGGVAGPQGREHGYLVLDASVRPTLKLDPPRVAQLPASIAEVYASACVGAVVGNNDTGSALGVCSEWQLRGVTSVIACLAPVEDHFMPLLAGLYWHRRLKGQVPHSALAGAKTDLCCGDWPAALIRPLRDAYRHTMQKVLARAIWRPAAAVAGDIADNSSGNSALRAAQTLRGWLLPPYVRSNHFDGPGFDADAHREFSARHCENAANAERLLRQCLGYLIDERARPEDLAVNAFAKAAIDNICTFTHCFGSGGLTRESHSA